MVDQLTQPALGHFSTVSAACARKDVLPIDLVDGIDGDGDRPPRVLQQQGIEVFPAFFVTG
jgi:hypothetical protein